MLQGRRCTSGRGRCRRRPRLSGAGKLPGCVRRSWAIEGQQSAPQSGQSGAMVALEVETLAAVGNGAHQNGLVRAEVIARVALVELLVKITANWPHVEHCSRKVHDTAA